MRLAIRHETQYRYDRPTRHVVQSHRLTPSVFDGQRTLAWSVTAEGGVPGAKFRDGAGDWVSSMTFPAPEETITVLVEGVVETTDLSGVLRGHAEKIDPRAYRVATPAIKASDAIRALAAEAAAGHGAALDRAHALCGAVGEAVRYRPGSSGVGTTAAEAMEAGAGVCQDQAHVLIALAQHHGLPARYAMGYLFTEGQAVQAQSQDGAQSQTQGEDAAGPATAEPATHAWAEIHIDGLGWVGFDPANACCPDARYVRLGSGRDAVSAAPIRGQAAGVTEERLSVALRVAAAPQSQ